MNERDIRRILVVGAGTMGQQIALQCALHGYDVNLYDIAPDSLKLAKTSIEAYTAEFSAQGQLTAAMASVALARIAFFDNPQTAATDVDLLSESVPEDPKIKARVLAQFHLLCPSHTIFTTNTSTLVPSQYALATGRPDRFAALHFHSLVWIANVVDIMPHPGTSRETLDRLEHFARSIGQIPILLKKESHSYLFNAMFDSIVHSALTLAANDRADVETIDRAWMGVTKMPVGPFGAMDLIGIDLIYDITRRSLKWVSFLPKSRRLLNFLRHYVERGQLGLKTSQGFYTYPDPAFQRPGFVEGQESPRSRSSE